MKRQAVFYSEVKYFPYSMRLLKYFECSVTAALLSRDAANSPKMLFIYIYNIPEPKPTRDHLLTKVPPLCSPTNAYFGDILSFYSLLLP